ncbi:hypothetical protein PV325_003264 [Microctonus aethiopoides]|nr:hypothetical protein PV325_003264 [Microctonus aethiopoides]
MANEKKIHESSASTVRKFQRIQQPGMSIDESRGGIDGAKRNHSRPGQSGPRDVTRYHPREFSCSLVHMERELMTETYITMRKKEEGNVNFETNNCQLSAYRAS